MISALFTAVIVVPADQTFQCAPTRLWGSDGPIWYAEDPRICLFGIAARAFDGSCSAGHPCPDTDPIDARDGLVQLIGKPICRSREGHILVRSLTMSSRSGGGASDDRTAAFCTSPKSGDVSCNMIAGGLKQLTLAYIPSGEQVQLPI